MLVSAGSPVQSIHLSVLSLLYREAQHPPGTSLGLKPLVQNAHEQFPLARAVYVADGWFHLEQDLFELLVLDGIVKFL